jgi:hypothetical protein
MVCSVLRVQQLLILGCRARRHGFAADLAKMFAGFGLQGIEARARHGLGGQDALHDGQGKCPVTTGALQSGAEILAPIGRQQRENALCLILAITAALDQFLEEETTLGAKLFETLLKKLMPVPEIASRQMTLVCALLPGHSCRKGFMAGYLEDVRAIDDPCICGNQLPALSFAVGLVDLQPAFVEMLMSSVVATVFSPSSGAMRATSS